MKKTRNVRGKITILFFFAVFAMIAGACGGGGGGTSNFSIGGTVTGLSGTLVLQNNGGDDYTLTAPDSDFTFDTALADGSAYAVTVSTQPAGQTCTVTNGSGTLSGGDVTNVTVICASTPGCNTVNITGDVTTNTTWTKGVYVIKKYDFYVSATLQIEAGTIIKFHPADGPYAMLSGAGTIVANGTAADPIVFTSFKDDDHCGDTNGDGTTTSPAQGDWLNVNTNGTQGSVFDYCEFYYGGGGAGYDSTLDLWDSRATVTNSTFAHNNGLNDGVLDAEYARANTVITGNVFYDNEKPMYINNTFNIDDSNVFHNPANPAQTNTYNGLFLWYPDVDFNSHISWEETEVPFVIDDNDLWINTGAKLTLGNNVVIKFMPDAAIVLDDGASALVNNDGPGVVFTSYKDDTQKGDTNGDGFATTPADGDWVGVYDNTLATPDPHYFTWPNMYYDSY